MPFHGVAVDHRWLLARLQAYRSPGDLARPVQWDGQHAPLYACEPCLDRLKAQALAYFMERRPTSA
jgi:hypothetical protein